MIGRPLTLLSFLFLTLNAGASETKATKAREFKGPPYFAKGILIELVEYNAKADAYRVVDVEYRAFGPFYGRVNEILKALPSQNAKKVRANPKILLGQQFQLEANVPTLYLNEAPKEPKGSNGG